MSRIVKVIGAFVVSALMYSVPIITTLAFTKPERAFLAYLLTICCLIQFACLVCLVLLKVEEADE